MASLDSVNCSAGTATERRRRRRTGLQHGRTSRSRHRSFNLERRAAACGSGSGTGGNTNRLGDDDGRDGDAAATAPTAAATCGAMQFKCSMARRGAWATSTTPRGTTRSTKSSRTSRTTTRPRSPTASRPPRARATALYSDDRDRGRHHEAGRHLQRFSDGDEDPRSSRADPEIRRATSRLLPSVTSCATNDGRTGCCRRRSRCRRSRTRRSSRTSNTSPYPPAAPTRWSASSRIGVDESEYTGDGNLGSKHIHIFQGKGGTTRRPPRGASSPAAGGLWDSVAGINRYGSSVPLVVRRQRDEEPEPRRDRATM